MTAKLKIRGNTEVIVLSADPINALSSATDELTREINKLKSHEIIEDKCRRRYNWNHPRRSRSAGNSKRA